MGPRGRDLEDAGAQRRLRRARERRARSIRRRRGGALGAAAAVAAILGAALGAGAGEEPAPTPEARIPEQCAGSDRAAMRRLAGQRLMVRTDGIPDAPLLARARRATIAGVIVFPAEGAERAEIRSGLERLQEAAAKAGPPLLVATDQEGGPVKRFAEAPPLRAPIELGEFGDAADARLEGRATGNFLRGTGINTDLAPVLDVPGQEDSVMSLRAFGSDAATVSRLGLAFAAGLSSEGVLAAAKHFPGLGRSLLNTDFASSEISAARRDLREDLRPFRAAVEASIPLIMVGLASYPQLGAPGPAALEPAIATELLRARLGFEGVSISDDLQAEAVSAATGGPAAARRAAAAGIDLLLFARTPAPEIHAALVSALERGGLELEAARESCVRVVGLREELAATEQE